ncbi:MAG: tRNA lysidine(34) synthetase TilS [Thermodesulfobacteriota bacterium]
MILEKVKSTIDRFTMFSNGETVIVAVSGGIDSVTLLDVLCKLKDELNLNIVVCHLNHALRGRESDGDLDFVRRLAAERDLLFEGRTLDFGELSGGSVQDKAREARYRFFEDVAKKHGATRVVLGHNFDDSIETVLMRIIAGTSLKGLSGIPPKRGIYVRPLIEVKRAEIERYAGDAELRFREDSSNESTKYRRNSLRLKLIPLIEKEFNPGFKDMLVNLSAAATKAYGYIEGEAEGVLNEIILEEGERITLDRKVLLEQPEALSGEIFLKAVERVKGDRRGVYSYHVDAFHSLLMGDRPNASIDLPSGMVLTREYETVVLAAGSPEAQASFEMELTVPGETALPGDSKIIAEVLESAPVKTHRDESTSYFDMELISFPLVARSFRVGDRMTIFGMEGRKKLKDIFIDLKVPAYERQTTALVTSAGDIIWAAGLRRSSVGKVTEKTGRILRLQIVRER